MGRDEYEYKCGTMQDISAIRVDAFSPQKGCASFPRYPLSDPGSRRLLNEDSLFHATDIGCISFIVRSRGQKLKCPVRVDQSRLFVYPTIQRLKRFIACYSAVCWALYSQHLPCSPCSIQVLLGWYLRQSLLMPRTLEPRWPPVRPSPSCGIDGSKAVITTDHIHRLG